MELFDGWTGGSPPERPARRRFPRLLVLAVAATALALVVSACGDDDDDDGSGASNETATTSADAPTGEPIKTTTITDLNSEGPVYPNIEITANAYEQYINGQGGIQGRPLEVDVCDAQGDPAQATACARKAVQDQAVAVVGNFTFTGDAIMPTLEAGNTAYFGNCCPLSPLEFSSKHSFPLGNQPLYGAGLVKRAVEDGCESIGSVIIEGAEAFGEIMDNAAKALGTSFTKKVVLPATAQDYSAQVAEATDGTDCLVMIVSETPYIAWMPAFAQSGTDVRMYGPQGNLNAKVAEGFEEVTNGDVIAGMYPDLALPQWDDYRQALEDANAPDGEDYNSLGGMGTWTAYEAFTQIVEEMTGEINHDTFFDAASKATVDLPNQIPVVDFTKEWTDGLPGFNRLINHSVVYSELQDGEVVPLTEEFEDVTNLALGKPQP